jgi:hypothetical protein
MYLLTFTITVHHIWNQAKLLKLKNMNKESSFLYTELSSFRCIRKRYKANSNMREYLCVPLWFMVKLLT